MKVSSAWIQEWLCRTISDENLVKALEQAGIEIEQYISSKPLDKKIVVALVKKVMQHPAADRLKLVFVDTGDRETRVVCGATNVAEGMKVALAQVGATLPSGDQIAAAKLRGELSEGMLCSEQELGLGPDHDGILALADNLELGARLCDIYPSDAIVDMKTQANRFDLLSVIGLAREVGAITNTQVRELPRPIAGKTNGQIISAGVQANRFMIARIEVLSTTPSPDWLTARLQASGVRPISPIVDVTNYVNLELGQPLHAYDAAKVKLPLTARLAKRGEMLVTLDGVSRKLTTDDLIIADQTGPIGLAGLMGGARTEVDASTTEILLEAATFDASIIRKMAKRHGLRTEASARFERGLPVQLPPLALARAVALLQEVVGAKTTTVYDQLNIWPWVQRIGLRVSLANRLLGFTLAPRAMMDFLARLGIEARPFDIAAEAAMFVGRPYRFGAKFRTDGTEAFDCSYLTDYLYSLIGRQIGHTAHGQYQLGRPVELSELVPGDLLFRGGPWENLDAKERGGVSHVALYVGDGQIIHASDYERNQAGVWVKSKHQVVKQEPLTVMADDPEYLGARRYVDDPADFLMVPTVPWWRTDLKEGQDLVEEIVRMYGYDKVPATIPAWRPREVSFDAVRPRRRQLQQLLYGAGLFEVMTYSFVSEEQLHETGLAPKQHLKLKNPLSTEQAYLRSSLLPSHLTVLARNRTYAKAVAFYELSRVFVSQAKGEQPLEPTMLAITLARPADSYRYLKGILDTLATRLNVELVVTLSEEHGPYGPGRAATISLGGEVLGWIGQLDPALTERHKLSGEVAFLELKAESLLDAVQPRPFGGLERFPSISRDVAVIVPNHVTWRAVHEALADLPSTQDVFVSDYYGEGVPEGHKSLALRLTLAYADRTPTEAQAADVERKALAILKRKFAALTRE